MGRHALVIVTVRLMFAGPVDACTVIGLQEGTADSWFNHATDVHLGTVRTTSHDAERRNWVIDVTETIKGQPTDHVTISLERLRGGYLEMCEPLSVPIKGDAVAVFRTQGQEWSRPSAVTPAIADRLRALGRSQQSNSTVERTSAKPAPAAHRER